MTGIGFNHYVARPQLDLALITGESVTGICGTRITPRLRVGNGGSAYDPERQVCAMCQLMYDEFSDTSKIDEEVSA